MTTNAIDVAYTEVDYFGCFGPVGQTVTTFFTPNRTQVMDTLWLSECGHTLDAVEQTILDLCLAGV
jgi:hypothetical protein